MRHLFLLLVLAALFSNCSKETNPEASFLVFGHFYGECMGEQCVEIFKIHDDKIFEDSNDQYPNQNAFYNGNFKEIDQSKFEQIKGLMDDFPMSLFEEVESVIGQPDAGDWGGLYIEYKDENQHDFWLLDQMQSNVPSTYHNFIDKVNEKIAIING